MIHSRYLFGTMLLFLLFNFSQARAFPADEKKYHLTGTVLDQAEGVPLEYATITVAGPDGKLLDGAVTDSEGKFDLLLPAGTYQLKVGFISFVAQEQTVELRQDLNLGSIELQADAAMLDEVEIVGETSTLELHLDKKVFNVGTDLTSTGGTVNDVLDNVPSVNVDPNGGISLRGNSGVTVLINGKPSVLAANRGLDQLPASSVEKVEVITNPSARYQAAGTAGIINIVLRRNKLQGFSGSFQATAGLPADHSATRQPQLQKRTFQRFWTAWRPLFQFQCAKPPPTRKPSRAAVPPFSTSST